MFSLYKNRSRKSNTSPSTTINLIAYYIIVNMALPKWLSVTHYALHWMEHKSSIIRVSVDKILTSIVDQSSNMKHTEMSILADRIL